jgi:hypothetical protein
MPVLNARDTIRYQITPNVDGVTLCVWEVARNNDSQQVSQEKGFLFKANHRLSSKQEAQELLKQYLMQLN